MPWHRACLPQLHRHCDHLRTLRWALGVQASSPSPLPPPQGALCAGSTAPAQTQTAVSAPSFPVCAQASMLVREAAEAGVACSPRRQTAAWLPTPYFMDAIASRCFTAAQEGGRLSPRYAAGALLEDGQEGRPCGFLGLTLPAPARR